MRITAFRLQAGFCALALYAAAAAAAPLYRITVIQPPPDDGGCIGIALNDLGQVTGYCTPRSGGPGAMTWSETEGFRFILPPDGGQRNDEILPSAINNNGVVTGTFRRRIKSGASAGHVFIWSSAEGMQLIGPKWIYPDRGDAHRPAAINDHNEVAGNRYRARGYLSGPFRWSPEAGYRSLRPADRRYTEVQDLNNAGVMAGATGFYGRNRPSAILQDAAGGVSLLASSEDEFASIAYAVNNLGTAAGSQSYETPDGYFTRAVLWRPDGSLQILEDDFPGTIDISLIADINDADQGVGYYLDDDGVDTVSAIYWDASTGIRELKALVDPDDPLYGVTDFGAYGTPIRINNAGQIVLYALVKRSSQAVLLTPITKQQMR
jgi:hypothetical protein